MRETAHLRQRRAAGRSCESNNGVESIHPSSGRQGATLSTILSMNRRPERSYAIAILASAAVLLGRWALTPVLGTRAPLMPLLVAVAAAAHYGGFRPGLLATLITLAAGMHLFLDVQAPFLPTRLEDQVLVLIYSFVGVFISVLAGNLQSSRRQIGESEHRFRTLVETVQGTSIVALDAEGRLISWNAGAERNEGYTESDVLGRPLEFSFIDSDRRANVPAKMLGEARSHGSSQAQVWRLKKDGSVYWADVRIAAFYDETAHVSGFSQVTRDLTGQRIAEDALKETEATTRALLESASHGVVAIDEDGRIEIVNATAEEMFGYSRAELIGGELNKLLPDTVIHRHPELISRFFARPTNTTLKITRELTAHRRDGSKFPIELSLSSVVTRRGKLGVAFVNDISRRKEADTERERLAFEVAEQRALLNAVFENAPIGIAVFDSNLCFVRLNDALARMNGLTKEAHAGRKLQDLLPGMDPLVVESLHRVIDNGESVLNLEITATTPAESDHIHFWRANYFPVQLNGKVAYASGLIEDVTAQKLAQLELEAANQELQRSNEDLTHFAYAASHDLQEPLRMVTSFTQMLAKHYGHQLDEPAQHYIRFAIDGALRMESLLHGLSEYWQINERTGAELRWVDCNRALDRALENLQVSVDDARAEIHRESLPTVRAHEIPMVQLFQNLVSNAVKYRHPDRTPEVWIKATSDGRDWIFSVRDNGIGIDPQYARQVFGIFKRLEGYKYGGAGIGLAIAEKIVTRFGGRIWVQSSSGNGADFRFTIPGSRSPFARRSA